jgi:hypothetical protein
MPRTWLSIRVELVQGCGDALGRWPGGEGDDAVPDLAQAPACPPLACWPSIADVLMATDDRPGGPPRSPLTVTSRDPA